MTNGKRRCLALTLMAGMMFLSSIFSLQGILLTSIISHYSLTDSAQGLASSAASFGGVIALFSSIFLIGKLPKLTLIRIAFFVCFAFLALLSVLPHFALFIALWLMLGIGMGYVDMLLSSCMADLYKGRQATKMMCLLHMLYGVSSMICPVIFSRLMNNGLRWNHVYLIVSAAGLALLLFSIFAVRFAYGSHLKETAMENRMSFRDMFSVVKKGALPGLIIAMLCHGFFLGGLNTWITRYISVNLSSGIGDMALSFLFTGVMISRLVMPFSKLDPKKYVRIAGFLAGTSVLLALPFHSGVVMSIAVFFCGVMFGAMIPCMLDIGCASTPESTMLATTLMMLALYLSQAIVSPIIGAIESAAGLDFGIVLLAVFMLLTSVCLIKTRMNGDKTKSM
ncbi:MAG: MFS transporter [Clostridia bacterium]|nr:MFS transporter [Clostridia bacterium]